MTHITFSSSVKVNTTINLFIFIYHLRTVTKWILGRWVFSLLPSLFGLWFVCRVVSLCHSFISTSMLSWASEKLFISLNLIQIESWNAQEIKVNSNDDINKHCHYWLTCGNDMADGKYVCHIFHWKFLSNVPFCWNCCNMKVWFIEKHWNKKCAVRKAQGTLQQWNSR